MIDYEKEAAKLGRLVQEKQAAYGDSFGKSEQIFKILYPNGVKPENYKDFLTLVRMVDKMFRIATKKDAFGENPFMDIQGYALLASVKDSAVFTMEEIYGKEIVPREAPKVLLGHQRDDGSDSRIQTKKDEIYAKYKKELDAIKASKAGAHAESLAVNEARRWLSQQLDAIGSDLEVELSSRSSRKCLCAGVGCSDCA